MKTLKYQPCYIIYQCEVCSCECKYDYNSKEGGIIIRNNGRTIAMCKECKEKADEEMIRKFLDYILTIKL